MAERGPDAWNRVSSFAKMSGIPGGQPTSMEWTPQSSQRMCCSEQYKWRPDIILLRLSSDRSRVRLRISATEFSEQANRLPAISLQVLNHAPACPGTDDLGVARHHSGPPLPSILRSGCGRKDP